MPTQGIWGAMFEAQTAALRLWTGGAASPGDTVKAGGESERKAPSRSGRGATATAEAGRDLEAFDTAPPKPPRDTNNDYAVFCYNDDLRRWQERLCQALASRPPDRGERRPAHRGALSSHPWVVASKLGPTLLKTLQRQAAGLMLFDDFMARRSVEPGSVLLGATAEYRAKVVHDATLACKPGLQKWQDAYDAFHIVKEGGHVDQFMAKLAARGKPIYFLVHDGMMQDPHCEHTRAELEWLVAHPKALARCVFVFGSRRCKTEGEWRSWERECPDSDSARYYQVGRRKMIEEFRAHGWAGAPA